MRNRASVRAFAATLAIAASLSATPAMAEIVARRDGSKAVYAPADTTRHSIIARDSFDWDDAAIGAGAVLAAGLAAAVSMRMRRRPRAMGLS